MDTASIPATTVSGEPKSNEAVTTRYGVEADLLPEESFYLICAYRYAGGERVSRRVLSKTASERAAERDVMDLRAGRVPSWMANAGEVAA